MLRYRINSGAVEGIDLEKFKFAVLFWIQTWNFTSTISIETLEWKYFKF